MSTTSATAGASGSPATTMAPGSISAGSGLAQERPDVAGLVLVHEIARDVDADHG